MCIFLFADGQRFQKMREHRTGADVILFMEELGQFPERFAELLLFAAACATRTLYIPLLRPQTVKVYLKVVLIKLIGTVVSFHFLSLFYLEYSSFLLFLLLLTRSAVSVLKLQG